MHRLAFLLLVGLAHVACSALDERMQDAVVGKKLGQPCFGLSFPRASQIDLAGVEVYERLVHGVRPVWQLTFADPALGGAHLREAKCVAFGQIVSGAQILLAPEKLELGKRYEVDMQVYAKTPPSQETRAYSFKASFCLRRRNGATDVHQVQWLERAERWDWEACL